MDKVVIVYQKVREGAKGPTKAYSHDACYDFFAAEDVEVPPQGIAEVPLGVRVLIPAGWEMCFRPRSSYGRKGLQVHPGTIDAFYTAELTVIVYNHTNETYHVRKGDKVVQAAVRRVPEVVFQEGEVPDLDDSFRGERGFGSSGR